MPVRIVFRKDTAANWAAINPVLLDGEVGLSKIDEVVVALKIGDGVTHWNDLSSMFYSEVTLLGEYITAALEATTAANDAAGLANTAATAANDAAGEANEATIAANTAAATALSYVGTSPTGAYINLAALQAAYPTGEDGVFVVKDTGHWYFWNGSAWEDGGEYQKDIPTTTIEELRRSDLQQMSAIKEVENTLNSININQETTNTASGYGPISLPKNASNGGMSVKLEGLTAENLVVNGDFRNGSTGWVVVSGINITTNGGYLTVNHNLSANATVDIYRASTGINVGDKIYAAYNTNHSVDLLTRLYFYDTDTFLNSQKLAETYTKISKGSSIATSTKNNPRLAVLITSLNKATDVLSIGNISLINLTTTFGAGNEPDLATCDAMFSDYFEGVKSFEPTGRVRSVGKNLFDKDRAKYAYGYYTVAGSFIPDTINKINISILNNIKVAPSTLYRYLYPVGILAARCVGYDKNGAFISEVFQDGANSGSFTTPVNCEYIKIGFKRVSGLTIDEVQTKGMHLQRTSIAPTAIEPYTESNLFLNAPELRSNGTVKDEIRKGSNGYELVKRVGEGTIGVSAGSQIITTYTNVDVLYNILPSIGGIIQQVALDSSTKNTLVIDGITECALTVRDDITKIGMFYISASNRVDFIVAKGTTLEEAQAIIANKGYRFTLATPEIIPISYGGALNSAENGTVYHEPIIADAGVYGTSLSILMTDYPIDSLEEIIKYEDGAETRLDTSTAVIASGGLSFTHPDLADGDLVLFTYAFDKESTSGKITATFYDSNVVKIDTATGTAYKIEDVVTNGILTRTLTEV